MRAIVGDETGLLKLVDIPNKQYVSYGEQSRKVGIQGISRLQGSQFSVLRHDGQLELWSITEEDSLELRSIASTGIESVFSSVRCQESSSGSAVVCYGSSGDVVVARSSDDDSWSNLDADGVYFDGDAKFNVKGPIHAAATCLGGVAFGGPENDTKFYDFNSTSEPVWTAANVPEDKLRLRVPIWVTALTFLRPDQDSVSAAHFATGTGHKHIRFYDTVAGRKPVTSMECGEFRVTAICAAHLPGTSDSHLLYVGDAAGGLNLWDLRMCRKLYTLKGSAGSIRDLSINERGNYLSCVGLDRILHVYNTKTNKPVSTVYLKNRLNRGFLTGSLGSATAGGASSDGDGSDNEDGEGADDRSEGDGEDVLEEYADSSDEEGELEVSFSKPTSNGSAVAVTKAPTAVKAKPVASASASVSASAKPKKVSAAAAVESDSEDSDFGGDIDLQESDSESDDAGPEAADMDDSDEEEETKKKGKGKKRAAPASHKGSKGKGGGAAKGKQSRRK